MWPYRPRENHESVPRWLLLVILVVAIGVLILLLSLSGQSPTGNDVPGG